MPNAQKKKTKAEDLKHLAEKLSLQPRSIWDDLDETDRKEADRLALRYLDFLSRAKTERAVVRQAVKSSSEMGFVDLNGEEEVKTGGFLAHHGKMIGLFRPGRKSPAEGFNLIVAHGDSPRLDLKPKCVYEETAPGFGMLRTNLYGGLKKFQWLARPLALWGFCALADGRTVDIVFGEDPCDPVLTVPDLLPILTARLSETRKSAKPLWLTR